MRQLFGLFEWFAREGGDSLFGVFAAESLRPEVFGPFVAYALQAPTLRAGIVRNNRGLRLHQRCSTMSLREAQGVATWTYSVDLPLTFGRHHHGVHALLQMLAGMSKYLGFRPPILECGFEAASYGKPGQLEDRLGIPVRWSCESNYLRFAADLLNSPPGAGRGSGRVVSFADLLRYARAAPPKTAIEKARAVLFLGLESSDTSADHVARQLGIGVWTLQRRLDAEGTTFRQVLDEVRRDRARELIIEGSLPLRSIAGLLGYSDPAHFTRAHQRWHGYPPSQSCDYRLSTDT